VSPRPPARRARALVRELRSVDLNGSVTLAPLPPEAKNSRPHGRSPRLDEKPLIDESSPAARREARWISGERECATGFPMTA